MSTPEDRLREAMRAHTESIHPTGAYDDVRERAAAARRARRVRIGALSGLATAAAVAIAVLAVSLVSADGDQPVTVGPAEPGVGSSTSSTPVTTVPDEADDPGPFVFVGTEIKPEGVALQFARGYLGMTDPVVVSGFRSGGPQDGEVDVGPDPRGPETTVGVRQTADGTWGVTFAASDDIRVSAPGPFDRIASPVTVTGEARAFEGTVQVEVRRDGQLAGDSLGQGFVTGSGGGEHGPFADEIDFEDPGAPAGAVVFYTTSAEDGSVWQATVVRVEFGEAPAADLAAISRDRIDLIRLNGDGGLEVIGRLEGSYFGVDMAANGDVWFIEGTEDCNGFIRRWGDREPEALGIAVAASPDGRNLAIARDPECDGQRELVVIEVGTNEERVIWSEFDARTEGLEPADVAHPAWSPDGRQLAFHVVHEGLPRLRVVRLDDERRGGTFTNFDAPDAHWQAPTWLDHDTVVVTEREEIVVEVDVRTGQRGDSVVPGAQVTGLDAGVRGVLIVTADATLSTWTDGALEPIATGYFDASW